MLLCYKRRNLSISVYACLISTKCILMEETFDSSEKDKLDKNQNNNGGSEINL